jgi:hypothetical protein
MTNETTKNFLQVMSEFNWPEPEVVSYRLYYNDNGTPKCYTMEDLPGKYIEIDCETYILHRWNVQVVNEKLIIVDPTQTVQKLQANTDSGTPCHPDDVCIVVDPEVPHTKWKLITNETN